MLSFSVSPCFLGLLVDLLYSATCFYFYGKPQAWYKMRSPFKFRTADRDLELLCVFSRSGRFLLMQRPTDLVRWTCRWLDAAVCSWGWARLFGAGPAESYNHHQSYKNPCWVLWLAGPLLQQWNQIRVIECFKNDLFWNENGQLLFGNYCLANFGGGITMKTSWNVPSFYFFNVFKTIQV